MRVITEVLLHEVNRIGVDCCSAVTATAALRLDAADNYRQG